MVSGREGHRVGTAGREAERVARVYATLSMAYEAIVRIRRRLPLFEQVCSVLVEQGQLRMAWVGEVDDHGWIVPIARAGVADGYLTDLRVSVRDVPEGQGPTGTAARECRHVFISDIATDERMAPWREAALARGYRSSAAFPLVVEDRCVAVLTAYASEPRFFDEQEVELFDRLAADLSFATEAMERDERRRAAEAELRASEERFRVAAESMLDSFTIVSPVRDPGGEIIDFRHEYINDAYCALVGFDRAQLLGHRIGERFPQFPGSDRFAVYRRVLETGEPCRTEAVHGEGAWAGTLLATRVIDTVIAPMGENLVVSARDVTERRRNEQELQLRGELLDLAHDAVIVRDPVESRVRFWNREAEAIYGYSRAEASGRVTHELLRTVFPESEAAVDQALVRHGRWNGELRHTRKDGTVIVVSSRQALQRDADGQPLAIIALNSDITERKRAEEQLARTATLLERTEEITKTGGWEYDLAAGKLAWTDEVYRIYGIERTSDPPDVAAAIAAYDPDSAAIIEATFARLVADGEPYDLVLTLVRADGERIWVRTVGRPVIENGCVVRVGGHIADITERKRAEEELVETTGLLERTQQISRTGGWEYDLATGNFTWTDEVYRIYGSEGRYGPVELERAMSAFDPESAPIVMAALDRLVADGEPCDLEVELMRVDGHRIWVRVVGEAVIEGGRVARVHGIIADVSDRRLVEEELRALNAELEQRVAARTAALQRANSELESFAYSVSHDLRAPLRALDGFSKALLEDYRTKLDEEGRHYLERICVAAVRMGNLIDGILQLSRMSRRRSERVRVDMSLLAREVVADLSDAEPDRAYAVEIQDGLFAEADRELVRTVLQNLLANAYKFTSKTHDPCIRLGAVDQDGVTVYYVADNGAGFDMAHAKGRLFRPFHRLHRDSEFPGDGIGLAIVVRCVHRHGGEVWAEGAVNQGATFYFSLTPGAHPPASAATGEGIIPRWHPSDGDEPE
jgi:PAS domain S-box-containing protein